MAEIDKRVQGKPIQKFIGLMPEVQTQLKEAADQRAAEASALLEGRALDRTHASTIKVEHGTVDYWVVLDDTEGAGAANVIEYGRPGDPETGKGHMEGLHVLRDAFNLRGYS